MWLGLNNYLRLRQMIYTDNWIIYKAYLAWDGLCWTTLVSTFGKHESVFVPGYLFSFYKNEFTDTSQNSQPIKGPEVGTNLNNFFGLAWLVSYS